MGKDWPGEPARKEVEKPRGGHLLPPPCRNPPQASAGRMGRGSHKDLPTPGLPCPPAPPPSPQSTQADSHGSWLSIGDKSDHMTKDFLSPKLYSEVTPKQAVLL